MNKLITLALLALGTTCAAAHSDAMHAATRTPYDPAKAEEHAFGHDDANMTHVAPGARGDIVWQFTRRGEYQFACLIPGHYEAGMVGKVVVR